METAKRFPRRAGVESDSILDVGDLVTLRPHKGRDGYGKPAVIIYRDGPLYNVFLYNENRFLSYLLEDEMELMTEFVDGSLLCVN